MTHLSASFSATLRVRLADSPGRSPGSRSAIGEAGGSLGAIDLVRVERDEKVRDVTVDASSDEHLERIVEAVRARRRRRGRARLRPHVPHPSRRQDRDASRSRRSRRATTSRWPTRPGVARSASAIADDPDVGLEPDDQAEHRRGRLRRHRGARARRHRAGGGDAGDGGQGAALQGVRRRRRVAALPRDEGRRTRSSRSCKAIAPGVRRHQPRGHLRAALLRDRGAPARRARHPRLPRRPARHGDRRPRRAPERAHGRRQADRGRQDRVDRRRRRRHRRHRHPPRTPARAT